MDISFKVEGLERIQKALPEVQKAVAREVQKALYVSAERIATDYKKEILNGEKTGRIYKRRTVVHQASAPGEAPASDTGGLVNSVHVALDSAFSSVMRVMKNTAMALELGTSKIAPRPAAVPAAEKNRRWIADRLNKAVRTGVISTLKK